MPTYDVTITAKITKTIRVTEPNVEVAESTARVLFNPSNVLG